MIDCMKGVLISGTGRAYRPSYKYVAAKTGTTNDSKDVWICGCSPYYSMAVWVGEDTPVAQSGIRAQGYIFQSMMNYLHQNLNVIDFEKPECVNIDSSGNLSYIIKEKENIRNRRIEEENNRKSKEIEKQQIRLDKLSYLLDYGLTLEEETARETIASNYLNKLENYVLTSSSQFEELDKLISDTKEAIEEVKDKNVYSKYMTKYNILYNSYYELKQTILQNEEKSKTDLWQSIIDKDNQSKENEEDKNNDVDYNESDNSNDDNSNDNNEQDVVDEENKNNDNEINENEDSFLDEEENTQQIEENSSMDEDEMEEEINETTNE